MILLPIMTATRSSSKSYKYSKFCNKMCVLRVKLQYCLTKLLKLLFFKIIVYNFNNILSSLSKKHVGYGNV